MLQLHQVNQTNIKGKSYLIEVIIIRYCLLIYWLVLIRWRMLIFRIEIRYLMIQKWLRIIKYCINLKNRLFLYKKLWFKKISLARAKLWLKLFTFHLLINMIIFAILSLILKTMLPTNKLDIEVKYNHLKWNSGRKFYNFWLGFSMLILIHNNQIPRKVVLPNHSYLK